MSVFICIKVDTSGNLCANKHIPNVWLEMKSNLHAHSTSLIHMLTINVKQLQMYSTASSKQHYPD